jgi:xanthine dehydrogenase YagS FAD-binding subunit
MNTFEWTDATTVAQALGAVAGGGGSAVAGPPGGDKPVFKAGGVDVLDLMKEHLIAPPRLVNIRNVRGLDYVRDDDSEGLRLGPLVTLARIDTDPAIRGRYVALADAAGHAATPQIRNMATVGGNLLQRPRCWYFRNELFHCKKKGGTICFAQQGENQYHAIFDNDTCAIVHPSAVATALVAYGGSIELTSSSGKREVKAEEFFTLPDADVHRENSLKPDEILTEIRVPVPAPGTRAVYIKQGEKESHDWPIAEVVVVMETDGDRCKRASVVLGAASPVPRRAKEAEAALEGKAVDENTARDAAKAALADALPLEHNKYKVPLFEAVIRRAIVMAAAPAGDNNGRQEAAGGKA